MEESKSYKIETAYTVSPKARLTGSTVSGAAIDLIIAHNEILYARLLDICDSLLCSEGQEDTAEEVLKFSRAIVQHQNAVMTVIRKRSGNLPVE